MYGAPSHRVVLRLQLTHTPRCARPQVPKLYESLEAMHRCEARSHGGGGRVVTDARTSHVLCCAQKMAMARPVVSGDLTPVRHPIVGGNGGGSGLSRVSLSLAPQQDSTSRGASCGDGSVHRQGGEGEVPY